MDYKITLLPLAKLDIKEIAEWYGITQKKLGKRFLNAVKKEVTIIKKNPFLFQIRYDQTRVSLLETFPYLIHFEINKMEIVIKAVIHTSRNSKNWKTRKN